MNGSGYAHICAGVKIEDHLVVTEKKEKRTLFDPDSGKESRKFETIQFTYTICGREMPIKFEEYPLNFTFGGAINRQHGWDMGKNFRHWLGENGFEEEDEESQALYYRHSYVSWSVQHPVGIIGAVLPAYSDADWHGGYMNKFLLLDQVALDGLMALAKERLTKIGCDEDPVLYLYAAVG